MGSTAGGDDDSNSFCLKWNDYASNISVAFRDLRRQSDFFDVTLLTKDGTIQAHKVILSACSEFFRDAFKRMQPPRSGVMPMSMYLHGVSLLELQSILEFMYQGEVNVTQDNLNDFLAVAEELQVKGLINKEDSKPPPTVSPLVTVSPVVQTKPPKNSTVKPAYITPVTSHVQSVGGSVKRSVTPSTSKGLVPAAKKVKQEEHHPIVINPADIEASSSGYVTPSNIIKPDPEVILDEPDPDDDGNAEEDYEGYEGYYDEEGGDESMTSDQGGQSESSQGNSRGDHLINLPDGRSRCDLCNKLFATRSSATCHYIRFHEISESYECCLCKKVCKNKMDFRCHIISKHGLHGKDIVQCYGKIVPFQ